MCKLANITLLSNNWDPLSLHSPAQHLVPNKIVLDDNIPCGIEKDLIFAIPVDPRGTVKLYIDNFIGLAVNINDNALHVERAPLLAVGSSAQEVLDIQLLPCNNMDAWPILIAETGPPIKKTSSGGYWIFV
jgi:hypothetical protein